MFIEGWLQCRTVHFRRVNQGRGVMSVLFAQQGWERDSLCQCMYKKGRRGILSVSVQQGWERDSLCMCTARVGKGFSLYVYSKGGRGILSVSA